MIAYEQNIEWLEWANRILNVTFNARDCVWISNIVNDKPIAVVVYSRFSPYNCEMSIATNGAKTWASRQFLRACYAYPFLQMHLFRITAAVEEQNTASLKMLRQLGHVEEARLSAWFGEQDAILFRMKKEECKWI